VTVPIILTGQVYLHPGYNEYLVVSQVTRTNIHFKGPGFNGMHDVETFLNRFGPVDPADLDDEEKLTLLYLIDADTRLKIGWVQPDEEPLDDE
jgi:hypothetical protein